MKWYLFSKQLITMRKCPSKQLWTKLNWPSSNWFGTGLSWKNSPTRTTCFPPNGSLFSVLPPTVRWITLHISKIRLLVIEALYHIKQSTFLSCSWMRLLDDAFCTNNFHGRSPGPFSVKRMDSRNWIFQIFVKCFWNSSGGDNGHIFAALFKLLKNFFPRKDFPVPAWPVIKTLCPLKAASKVKAWSSVNLRNCKFRITIL